jgi:hypothetical protein
MDITIPTNVVQAKVNDGWITIRVSSRDLPKLIEILQYNNVQSLHVKDEDWKHWDRLGPFE